MNSKKQHWEYVFQNKTPDQVSWTEAYPQTSVELIQSFKLNKNAPIIDIGGGDSLLVDALLNLSFTNLTVLDISGKALQRAKDRLGDLARKVKWIESDILNFKAKEDYALWHDRACFHFLTEPNAIEKYHQLLFQSNAKHLVLGAFSTFGPLKCSGLPITQYDCEKFAALFTNHYDQLECKEVSHTTPFKTNQEFIFSRFEKKSTPKP